MFINKQSNSLPQFKLVLYFHISDLQFKTVSNHMSTGYLVPMYYFFHSHTNVAVSKIL